MEDKEKEELEKKLEQNRRGVYEALKDLCNTTIFSLRFKSVYDPSLYDEEILKVLSLLAALIDRREKLEGRDRLIKYFMEIEDKLIEILNKI